MWGRIAWLGFGAACVAALALAALAPKIAPDPEADDATRRSVYYSASSEEPSLRTSAAKSFPTDPWSQDDDFHNQEFRRIQNFASADKMSVGSLLAALDEGMRARWPHSPSSNPRPTVPPCRPRPIY